MVDTRLGRALAAPGTKKDPSRFAAAIAGARQYIPWTIPRLGVETEITLVGSAASELIEGEVLTHMAAIGIVQSDANVAVYEIARARRFAALAVLEPVTHVPIGTPEQWGDLDVDTVYEFWRRYNDLRELSDPVVERLTFEEIKWICESLKKNEPRLLRLCGLSRLSRFMLSMDVRQLASLNLKFGDGESQLSDWLSPESPTTPEPPTS